jgi:PAS domain-containing protein
VIESMAAKTKSELIDEVEVCRRRIAELQQEQSQVEAELRKSERGLADLFENAPVGIHCFGPDGVILKVNQTELDLLGYERHQYVGRHISEFHEDQEGIADILTRL